MTLYLVYDSETGEVVHTHASYVLGSDEPVSASEQEVLALAPRPDRGRSFRVARAPARLDIGPRTQRLEVDPASGAVRVRKRKQRRRDGGRA